MSQMHKHEEIKEVRAETSRPRAPEGNITTGETLCDPGKMIILERVIFPTGDPRRRRAEDQGQPGAWASRSAEGSLQAFACAPTRRMGKTIISGWASCTSDHRRPHEARVQRERARRRAPGGVAKRSRELPVQIEEGQVHQESGGRHGHVWPCLAQGGAERGRQGIRVRRRDQGRLGSARVIPGGGKGAEGDAGQRRSRPAIRSWTSRSRCSTAQLSTSRLKRERLQDRPRR